MQGVTSSSVLARSRGVEPFVPRGSTRGSRQRTSLVVRAGLFDFLSGGSRAGGAKANELVEELLTVSKRAGSNPSQASKQQVADLAEQLKRFRPRAPTKSQLFWGEYEVTFSSNPKATGGPILRSAPGQLFFGNQKPRQTIQPGLLVNSVQYKALGLLPGRVTQNGELSIIDGNTYKVDLEPVGGRGGAVTRKFEVLFLDARVRVVRFLPDGESKEPTYFVLERVQVTADLPNSESAEPEEPKQLPWKGGTRRLGRPVEKKEEAGSQVQEFTAALRGWQEKNRSLAQQLREAEKAVGGANRAAKPARANIDRVEKEATEVELQVAAAVEAARAADERYQQALSDLRQLERAGK